MDPLRSYGGAVVLDNSAWARTLDGRLTEQARKQFERALASGELWTCPPALLEMRFSARDREGFLGAGRELSALPYAPLTAAAADAAVQAQEELAVAPGVSHRVKPVDLLIAAVAASEGLGVLHYDGDYDTIAEHTSLRFVSVWVAPKGSIE
jgi:predicted nucleic acid-binding protein